MTYSVTLYSDTGFNAVNVPINKGLFATLASQDKIGVKTADPLNINQGGLLDTIIVRATWGDVKAVDYVKLELQGGDSWFYYVDRVTMTSPDVAVLSVTLDAWTTAGGTSGITGFLDGIVERHHIPKNADNFGAYCEPDPYLVPSKPLELMIGARVPITTGSTVVESTVALTDMAIDTSALEYTSTNIPSGGTASVCTVPEVLIPAPGKQTQIQLIGVGAYTTPASVYYLYADNNVREGIRRARSLGVEASILNCWKLPDGSLITRDPNDSGIISNIQREFEYANTNLNYIFANTRNKRVCYGDLCKYVILSIASGNKASFNPEDIFDGNEASAPRVKYICDPRPNGTPHFRYEYYLGDTTNFWDNCIQGLPNPTAPLVYRDKSGSEIDRLTFNTEQTIRQSDATVAVKQADTNSLLNMVGNIGPEIGSFGRSVFEAAENIVGLGLQKRGIGSIEENAFLSPNIDINRKYYNARAKELQAFNVSTQIVVPQVDFPRSETLRDFVGNGCCTYRLKPSATDIAKFDKILDMYGYKDTVAPDVSMFTARSKFSYLRIAGASFTTIDAIPLWLRDAVAAQFAAGIRIWRDKPDSTAYVDGSNV